MLNYLSLIGNKLKNLDYLIFEVTNTNLLEKTEYRQLYNFRIPIGTQFILYKKHFTRVYIDEHYTFTIANLGADKFLTSIHDHYLKLSNGNIFNIKGSDLSKLLDNKTLICLELEISNSYDIFI